MKIKCNELKTTVLSQTYIFLNMGRVLAIKLDFILGTSDETKIRIYKITYLGSLIGD